MYGTAAYPSKEHLSGNGTIVLVKTMTARGEVQEQLHSFLTSALHEDERSDSSPSDFTPSIY
jgi:hypothetical protein